MALRRHRKTDSSKSTRTTHEDKLRALSRAGRSTDPTDKRRVTREYAELRADQASRTPRSIERPASAAQRKELKAHGFRVTKRGVIVDSPRDKHRKQLPGARTQVKSGGVIIQSVKQRRDFIYGFTAKEKREFAKDPAHMESIIFDRLRKRFKNLRRAKVQSRLQWGAYQATKDFSPTYFTAKYFAEISPEEMRREGKRDARPRADKLTGLHFVVHIPSASTARKRKGKNAKGKKRK